jgi:hypothetical protein
VTLGAFRWRVGVGGQVASAPRSRSGNCRSDRCRDEAIDANPAHPGALSRGRVEDDEQIQRTLPGVIQPCLRDGARIPRAFGTLNPRPGRFTDPGPTDLSRLGYGDGSADAAQNAALNRAFTRQIRRVERTGGIILPPLAGNHVNHANANRTHDASLQTGPRLPPRAPGHAPCAGRGAGRRVGTDAGMVAESDADATAWHESFAVLIFGRQLLRLQISQEFS